MSKLNQVKVYTKEDGAIFTQLLWDLAHQISPEFIFAIFTQITDHIEITDTNANLVFTKEFQDIQGVEHD